jgi:hypothetical protein
MLTKNTLYSMLNSLFDWKKRVKFKACILQQKKGNINDFYGLAKILSYWDAKH